MASKPINATEAARNFSDVLNRVKYQETSFDVIRGGEVVARIVPPLPSRGVSSQEMNQIMKDLPTLATNDADSFQQDIESAVNQLIHKDDAWD